MKIAKLTLVFLLVLSFNACNAADKSPDKEIKVEISTTYGKIILKLYDETPKHRDNFVKLIKQGWYEGSIFHRIIKDFMIQGGGSGTGKSDPGYTVDAEILPRFFHKKGALAAARMGDQVNPQRKSSGSQFYIVQGRIFNDSELTLQEAQTGKTFSEEQKNLYKSIGGTPHLDGAYTVFGEVVQGLDVVDKIAAVKTGVMDKPVEDVLMNIKIIE